MKQIDLLNRFFKHGWRTLREGGNHLVLTNGADIDVIPRHKEVNEKLAKALIRRWGL